MATPTATGGDTSPNRDGPPGTRVNVPGRATQLPPPPRCTGPDAPTATNRHFISVHSTNMTQFTVLVRRLSPKCSQLLSRGQRGRAIKRQEIGDWLLFCTPRSVSVDTACITTHAYHPPITNTHPNNINTWHATPHHTTHRTPHMTPPTHTPPHTPHTLSLPPSPLRHSPLVAHHPPPNTTPHHPSSPPTRPHLHVPEPPCSPLLLEVFTPQPLTARACTRPCRDGHQAGHRNSLVSFSFRVVPTDTHPCSHPQHHCMME